MSGPRLGPVALAAGITLLWAVAVAADIRWLSVVMAGMVLAGSYAAARVAYEAGRIDGRHAESLRSRSPAAYPAGPRHRRGQDSGRPPTGAA